MNMDVANINWALWLALLPVYGLYEYVGTKNTLATAKLQAVSASNTSILMYLIGVLGTYIVIVDGLLNLIPIIIGAWFGTYFSIKWEIKILKKNAKRSRLSKKGVSALS